jgi:hypothetical protein
LDFRFWILDWCSLLDLPFARRYDALEAREKMTAAWSLGRGIDDCIFKPAFLSRHF